MAQYPWEEFYSEKAKAFNADDLPTLHLGTLMKKAAKEYGERKACTTVLPNGAEGGLTYEELDHHSDNLAIYLREELQLGQGDVVAIMSPNCNGYPVASFGVFKSGCVSTNINPLYTEPEMEHQLQDSNAKVLIVIDVFGDKVDEVIGKTNVKHVIKLSVVDFFPGLKAAIIGLVLKYVKKAVPPMRTRHVTLEKALKVGMSHRIANAIKTERYIEPVGPDDTAVYQYTGGTTGRSKGAELSHRSVLSNAFQMVAATEDDRMPKSVNGLVALPLYHIFAFTFSMINGLLQGYHAVMVPSPRPPSNLKPVFDKYDISVFPAVNTLFAALPKEDWFTKDVAKKLIHCVAGGTALQEAVAKTWEEKYGITIIQGYGLTESSCALTVNPQSRPKLNSIGLPLPGIVIKIVDDEGNEAPVGESGELIAKGPNIMKGYLDRPDETANTVKDGWLYTGDVAKMDEEGYFYIVDRMKDMILVSGFNVYPNEVEDAIAHMGGVSEVAVIGVPDDQSGEAPKAFVVKASDGLTEDEIRAHCKDYLTGYKRPKEIEFIEEIPKSPVGKLLRKELRARELERRKSNVS